MATEVKPRDGVVEVNGLKLHYLDWGNQAAQPMLLLHGFTGHAHVWDLFASALCGAYHIVALDQRGHGDSDWAVSPLPLGEGGGEGYRPELSVIDVDGVVQKLGLHRIVLLGHSMGGGNAIHYTSAHPAEVERLIIVDIGPETASAGITRINDGIQAPDEFDSENEAVHQAQAAAPGADEGRLARIRTRTLHNLKRLPSGRLTWKWDKALRDPARPRPRRSPEEGWAAVRSITCPTLLARGADSDILAAEVADRMVSEMPNCKLVTIERAGHGVPAERPAEFEAAIRAWLGV